MGSSAHVMQAVICATFTATSAGIVADSLPMSNLTSGCALRMASRRSRCHAEGARCATVGDARPGTVPAKATRAMCGGW